MKIPAQSSCPTLRAVDIEIHKTISQEPKREYLGMSSIGGECYRKIWYNWRWCSDAKHLPDHATDDEINKAVRGKKAAESGHRAEEVQANYLRMVPGIELETEHPQTGEQFEFVDFGGHLRGHCDGFIKGILEAPKTQHIWEHKEREEKWLKDLEKLKKINEKMALQEWSDEYYGQAQLYMHYSGTTRHFLTCSTMGVRRSVSVRTNYCKATAEALRSKAEKILSMNFAPQRAYKATHYICCKYPCPHFDACHKGAALKKHCRTCKHARPVPGGLWGCRKTGKEMTKEQQLDMELCGGEKYEAVDNS